MSRLTLVIPDLWAPLVEGHLSAEQLPPLSNLQRMLSRALRVPCELSDYTSLLCHLLQVTQKRDGALPLAALSYLADFGTASPGWYLRVDPVHLQIGRDHLSLLDQYYLQVSETEANQLIAALNEFWRDQDLTIQRGAPERWYLYLDTDPQLHTFSLAEAAGRHVQSYLLQGAGRQRWQTYMNEVQMMLHASPVNSTRESQGRPTINSVWLWGEGSLTQFESSSQISNAMRVYSQDPVALGLARFAGANVDDQPDNLHEDILVEEIQASDTDDIMIVLHQPSDALYHGDYDRWLGWLMELNASWVPALSKSLANKSIKEVTVYITGDGSCQCYQIFPNRISRWWVRERPLKYFIR